jgi:tetratricopeptide (TPR) repeat protein
MIDPADFMEAAEAYDEQRLTPEDRRAFEQQLSTDEALQTALHDYRLLRHSIEAIDLKRRLNALHDRLEAAGTLHDVPVAPFGSVPPAAPVRALPGWRTRGWWLAAAGLAVVLGLVWLLTQPASGPDPQALYAAYYRPEPPMRGPSDCPATSGKAIASYRAAQYRAALDQFANVPDGEACTLYYRGLCQLALDDPKAAITSLETAKQQSSGSLRQRAEWYLALAYLADEVPDKAHAQLQEITAQPRHPFGRVAGEVLGQLN